MPPGYLRGRAAPHAFFLSEGCGANGAAWGRGSRAHVLLVCCCGDCLLFFSFLVTCGTVARCDLLTVFLCVICPLSWSILVRALWRLLLSVVLVQDLLWILAVLSLSASERDTGIARNLITERQTQSSSIEAVLSFPVFERDTGLVSHLGAGAPRAVLSIQAVFSIMRVGTPDGHRDGSRRRLRPHTGYLMLSGPVLCEDNFQLWLFYTTAQVH